KGVDIHLHETGTAGVFSLEEIIKRTKALSMSGQVTVSHAFALSSNPDAEVHRVLDLLDEAGIGLTTIAPAKAVLPQAPIDRKSTRLNSSHVSISYAVFCLKKKSNSPRHI